MVYVHVADIISASVQQMPCRQSGDKPLAETNDD